MIYLGLSFLLVGIGCKRSFGRIIGASFALRENDGMVEHAD